MSAIDQYIERIPNKELQEQLRTEIARLTQKKRFGLVFENHLPDNITLPEVKIRCGTKVVLRDTKPNDIFEVQSISDDKTTAICRHLVSLEDKTINLSALIAVAQRGDVIYPYLKPMDSVMNAPGSDLWHTLIEADNYHALQLLAYLYPGKVDCIYIDPPYNKPDSHDWKYNCDYVDGNDSYRHSKWLSMIEARLKIAKKLLNPKDSVLIVTIDELEFNHLGCLLEQMFPEAKIQMISSVINPSGVSRGNEFYRTDEYIYYVRFGDSSPAKVSLSDEWITAKTTGKNTLRWRRIRRQGSHDTRADAPNQFYPIYVSLDGSCYLGSGDSLPIGVDKDSVQLPSGCISLWPIKPDGTEGCWQISQQSIEQLHKEGFIKVTQTKKWGITPQYLAKGEREKIAKGLFPIVGKDEYGTLIIEGATDDAPFIPGTQWRISSHNAREQGAKLLRKFFGDKPFDFPKSLYAVHDTLRFFLDNKPNALILDFFAGSGTTLHAVNLLNKEDGGERRCIMVTNNEIGEPKENELKPQGIRPGDEEWEKWGIARYVNWPRTKCSILGVDVNSQPIRGEYITSLTETKQTSRKFTQINFLPINVTLRQKKALVTLINRQKDIKLPTMSEDLPFLVSEDDDYNASILFDVNEAESWMESLDGNNHITNLYIVSEKDTKFKSIKAEVSELMGQIEETVPVTMPMSEGFKANAAYFKLGFLDKRAVSKGKQLKELLPLLWLKAGSIGECPTDISENYSFFPNNRMAILVNESLYPRFKDELSHYSDIEVVYIITDSQSAYLNMIQDLKELTTYQLYRDYLENFRINYAVK